MTTLRTQLAELHRESYAWALACCSRDDAFAGDVLQTVYLKVLDGRARFNGHAALKTWLFAVIRNTAADESRRRSREDICLALLAAEPEPDGAEPPDELFEREQRHASLRDALAVLPPRQQEVLRLSFFHGLSLAEVAEVIGISIGSVRQHYERGKQRLRDRLAPLETQP